MQLSGCPSKGTALSPGKKIMGSHGAHETRACKNLSGCPEHTRYGLVGALFVMLGAHEIQACRRAFRNALTPEMQCNVRQSRYSADQRVPGGVVWRYRDRKIKRNNRRNEEHFVRRTESPMQTGEGGRISNRTNHPHEGLRF